MHNHKVVNDKPNETGISNGNCRNKDTCPLPKSCQTKCIVHEANIDCYNNVTMAHVKKHLKIVSGIIKSHSITLNTKTTLNYQKNFWKLKSAVEHQKSHGRLSEYVVLTIQTVSAAFYV